MIADDNQRICQTLVDILTQKGYLVETVKNGYELLIYLKVHTPQILILDLMMPEKDGVEILDTVKGSSPEVKIIIYTGFRRYEHSLYAREADRFLVKSDDPEKLLQAIEEMT